MARRHLYLVAIETDLRLSDSVVDNYVQRSVKHYYERDPQRAFENVPKPRVLTKRISYPSKEETIRTIVKQISELKEALDFLLD